MKKSFKEILATALLGISILGQAGCIPLIVGAAAGAGGYVWVKGSLEKDFEATADRTRTAAVRALKELKLNVLEDYGDRLKGKVVGEFADGEKVTIDIEALTERVAKARIRVGLLGDKPKSEIILAAMQRNI